MWVVGAQNSGGHEVERRKRRSRGEKQGDGRKAKGRRGQGGGRGKRRGSEAVVSNVNTSILFGHSSFSQTYRFSPFPPFSPGRKELKCLTVAEK